MKKEQKASVVKTIHYGDCHAPCTLDIDAVAPALGMPIRRTHDRKAMNNTQVSTFLLKITRDKWNLAFENYRREQEPSRMKFALKIPGFKKVLRSWPKERLAAFVALKPKASTGRSSSPSRGHQ